MGTKFMAISKACICTTYDFFMLPKRAGRADRPVLSKDLTGAALSEDLLCSKSFLLLLSRAKGSRLKKVAITKGKLHAESTSPS